MSLQPLASLKPILDRCLLCNSIFSPNESNVVSIKLSSIQELSIRWSNLPSQICAEPPYNEFINVQTRFPETDKVKVHDNCRINFRTRIGRKESQYEKNKDSQITEEMNDSSAAAESNINGTERRQSLRIKEKEKQTAQTKVKCFVCNIVTDDDNNEHTKGGLGRCELDSSREALLSSMKSKLEDNECKHYDAAKRLEILGSSKEFDLFAIDVYYHKNCYTSFTRTTKGPFSEDIMKEIEDKVVDLFLKKVELRVCKDKDVFLLVDLLTDLKEMSSEFGLDLTPKGFKQTYQLKNVLLTKLEDKIKIVSFGKRDAVLSKELDPLAYSYATLKGNGMREVDVIKSFANLVRKKIDKQDTPQWPPKPDEFIQSLKDSQPLQCIFNAIVWSNNPKKEINENGYAETNSELQAEKIAAITECWEGLVSKKKKPSQTAMSLTLHRLTGSKEATVLLNRCGMGISYTDVRLLTNEWGKGVSQNYKKILRRKFHGQKSAHVTFDNSDGKQQTLTGFHTTHHTTGTIFQTASAPSGNDNDCFREFEFAESDDQSEIDYGKYKIPKKKESIQSFEAFSDKYKDSHLLTTALYRDLAWAIVNAIGIECLKELNQNFNEESLTPVGSWTAFMKDTATAITEKANIEYLPVIPFRPDDNIVKYYLDMINELTEELGLEHVFVHADEAIHSKINMIMWLEKEKYEKIVPILGGFHTLLVYLKILHKKFGCLGMQDWWSDANAVAEGSVDQAIEGRNYDRGMRLHKQTFCALVRWRLKNLNPNDDSLKVSIAKLRADTNSKHLTQLMKLESFKVFCKDLLTIPGDGTQAKMILEYMKDVSKMLALVYAVREKSIELHAAAERELLPKCFAFDHVNYCRYLTTQHISWQNIEINKPEVWDDLKQNGFGGSRTGEPFSTIHGDLITETTINREVKVRGGPMRGGFSTSEKANDTFIKTSHLMATIRRAVEEKLDYVTSSVHKEMSPGSRKQHDRIVQDLTKKLEELCDPFLDGPARHFKTGVQIDVGVIKGLLESQKIGEDRLKKFIEERVKAKEGQKRSVFEKIPRENIATGLKKEKKKEKQIDVLKEDRQAFGLLVGKVKSPEEALEYPLTTLPFALADPDNTLRQGTKSTLRNHLKNEAKAECTLSTKESADWFIDGMAAVAAVKVADTWENYAKKFFNFCKPKSSVNRLFIIFDSYRDNSIKQMTQLKRGQPGRDTFITNLQQKMPRQSYWSTFLRNGHNKMQLISALVKYLKQEDVRQQLVYPIIITEEEKTWYVVKDGFLAGRKSNHIEADTRIIMEALKSQSPVVVKAADTDILILMVYAYLKENKSNKWFMQIDSETFVSINSIVDHFGPDLCKCLPAYHSITGSDTTSYPANVGKIRPLKKMIKSNKENLIGKLGDSLGDEHFVDALTFFKTVMYSGKDNETITQIRAQMYANQKIKSSTNLIPDESSVQEHLKRVNLQAFIWKQCSSQNMEIPPVEGHGWKDEDGQIKPVWYLSDQLPACLSAQKKTQGYTADSEEQEDPDAYHTNRQRQQHKRSKRKSSNTKKASSSAKRARLVISDDSTTEDSEPIVDREDFFEDSYLYESYSEEMTDTD